MRRPQFTAGPPHIVAILKFLQINGASRFALEWLQNYLGSKYFWPEVTIILAPSDVAIRRLEVEANLSFKEIASSKEGLEILLNHLSILPTKTEWPMITALSDEKYGSSQGDILALKPVAHTIIETVDLQSFTRPLKTSVIVINSVIIHGDQLVDLKRLAGGFSKWWRSIEPNQPADEPNTTGLTGTELTRMSRDVFRHLVLTGQLKGKNVLALCTGNSDIANLCDRDNYLLYQQLLKSEFNYEWRLSDLPITAKDVYKMMHEHSLGVYIRLDSDQYNYVEISDYKPIPADVESKIDELYRFSGKPYEHFFIPIIRPFHYLEGSFQIFYIAGRPRTAVLVRFDYSGKDENFSDIYETAELTTPGEDAVDSIIFMSSEDLRNYLYGKRLDIVQSGVIIAEDLTLGELLLDADGSNTFPVEILVDGQKETLVMLPLSRELFLTKR